VVAVSGKCAAEWMRRRRGGRALRYAVELWEGGSRQVGGFARGLRPALGLYG